jgi:iron complex transport system substrate-binding protein
MNDEADGRAGSAAGAPRVVSLAPGSTATLAAMGAADLVVGATAHCDLDRPVVGGWLNPDYDRIADLDPDLVCTSDDLQSEIRDELRARGHEVCHLEPDGLDAVVDSFETLGRAVGRPEAGAELAADARARLVEVVRDSSRRFGDQDPRPVVYCEEWSDPPTAAGNWVPEAVEAAGGRYPFLSPGERSEPVSRAAVEAADPDHVVLHLCGRGDRVAPESFLSRGWDVDAEVHVLDDDLLNQPSPRLLDGVETLASIVRD